jgi:hypothetical protein
MAKSTKPFAQLVDALLLLPAPSNMHPRTPPCECASRRSWQAQPSASRRPRPPTRIRARPHASAPRADPGKRNHQLLAAHALQHASAHAPMRVPQHNHEYSALILNYLVISSSFTLSTQWTMVILQYCLCHESLFFCCISSCMHDSFA